MMMPVMTEMYEQDHRINHGFFYGDGNAPIAVGNASKRIKTAHPASTSVTFPKEKKDGVGERVAALQQLVSPFGKTDTASVLLEATEYIRFLHDQLQVLSTPYIRTPTPGDLQEESEYYSLSGRGLCLMPVKSAGSIVGNSSNGADLWAPANASKMNYKLYLSACENVYIE